jgi:hypothetical protein
MYLSPQSGLAVFLILVWVAICTYGDMLFKRAPSIASWDFTAAAVTYLLSSFVAFWTFRLQQWGWIAILWSSTSLTASLFLSVVMFGEPFTIRRRVAAALILAAIFLTE